MFVTVTGGSGSGKSAFAEEQILKFPEKNRLYIATMVCFDEESRQRVKRHRKMRKEKHFDTLECPTDLVHVRIPKDTAVLLECMSTRKCLCRTQPPRLIRLCLAQHYNASDRELFVFADS